VLGFPVMGIWPPDSDGTDINSLDRSPSGQYLLTADDKGRVSRCAAALGFCAVRLHGAAVLCCCGSVAPAISTSVCFMRDVHLALLATALCTQLSVCHQGASYAHDHAGQQGSWSQAIHHASRWSQAIHHASS
jgi:hypothetical protein